MKIVVFAPHPDDEIFGCGGSILKWLNENHDVHIVYVTDNRALITWGLKENELLKNEAKEYLNLNDDEIAKIGLKEALDAAKAFGFVQSNIHLLNFHDQNAMNQVDLGISLSKEIIKDTDRILLPRAKDFHPDHRATHLIAKGAAKEVNLKNAEFYVYYMNTLNVPKDKRAKVKVSEYRDKLYGIMTIYKTQICLKGTRFGWQTLKRRRSERFGVFKFDDMDKYADF